MPALLHRFVCRIVWLGTELLSPASQFTVQFLLMRFPAVFVLCLALAAQSHASVSKQDARAARDAFKRGLKLQHQKHDDEAFASFQEAARLNPENRQYITARELMRQRLVSDHLKNGNAAVLSTDEQANKSAANRRVEAMAEFQAALNLDPKNDYALQRLDELTSEVIPLSPTLARLSEQSQEVRSEEHTSELQSHSDLVCRLLLEKKK